MLCVYDKDLCKSTIQGKVPLRVCHGQRKLAEWGKEGQREIFPRLGDSVILIKSRRAVKKSWEIKSVQRRRTHVEKHGGKNKHGERDKRMKATPQSLYAEMDSFLDCEVMRRAAVFSSPDYSDVWHFQKLRKQNKTETILCTGGVGGGSRVLVKLGGHLKGGWHCWYISHFSQSYRCLLYYFLHK